MSAQVEQDRFTKDEVVDAAIRKAAKKALADHKKRGIPISVWLNGKVVEIAPEDIPDEVEAAS